MTDMSTKPATPAVSSSAVGGSQPVPDRPSLGGRAGGGAGRVLGTARRHGVLLALAATVVLFSTLRPQLFPTLDNAETMLRDLSPLAIAAFGMTVVLVMTDFDLSLGAMIGLGGTTAVVLMSKSDVNYIMAIVLTLGLGAVVGLTNGLAVAYAGASSFVVTLAMGTVLQGVEYQVSGQQSVFQNIPAAYKSLANAQFLGLSSQVYVALVVFAVLFVLLERSEIGRYMYAIGGNMEAARLAGLPVRRLRVVGFMIGSACAAVSGMLLTSQAGQSTPDLGLPYLLPVFAAVFLGSTAVRVGKFNIMGTLVGAIFLQVISTGLILLELKPAYINIVQGAILAGSVLLARVGAGDGRR
jgi:ribose transport system permease protein